MSEESTPTREQTVTANITAIKNKFGNEAHIQIISQCVQDISKSIAMLVDSDTSSSNNNT